MTYWEFITQIPTFTMPILAGVAILGGVAAMVLGICVTAAYLLDVYDYGFSNESAWRPVRAILYIAGGFFGMMWGIWYLTYAA